MGGCASTQYTNKGGDLNQSWKSMVNIVQLDGRLQQFKEPIKAWHVLSENPNCFLCSSESMFVGSPLPPVIPSEELQLGLIYFIVPISKSRLPLSLQDLGQLALKANAAFVPFSEPKNSILNSTSVSKGNFRTHPIDSNVCLGCSH